jgi:hypothetical protein
MTIDPHEANQEQIYWRLDDCALRAVNRFNRLNDLSFDYDVVGAVFAKRLDEPHMHVAKRGLFKGEERVRVANFYTNHDKLGPATMRLAVDENGVPVTTRGEPYAIGQEDFEEMIATGRLVQGRDPRTGKRG